MWADEGRVFIQQRSPRTYDGLDMVFRGPLDATFRLEFRSSERQQQPVTVTIPLRDILQSPIEADMDDRGSRLLVRRTPGDTLRVNFAPRPLVFAPGEVFSFALQPHVTSIPEGTQIEVETLLRNVRTDESAWIRSQKTVLDPTFVLALDIPMPTEEGVYEVVISVKQTPALQLPPVPRVALGFPKTLATRKIQLVVVNPQVAPPAGSKDPALRTVVEIDPASPGWWKRFSSLPKIPGLPQLWQGPLGNGRCDQIDHSLGRVSRLKPSPRGDLSWEAYSLPIQHPGRVHILEIEYPAEAEQVLGISVFEPDASGALMPVQLDSGVIRSRETLRAAEAEAPKRGVHRVPFWPRTKAPLVLVHNLSTKKDAVFGKIRVLDGYDRLPENPTISALEGRLFAAYFARPLFPECFCASESLDDWSKRSLDDWTTFYEGATRFIEYLRYVGYNGAMVSVLCDGSGIYPSEVFDPTPRYDKGVFFNSGQDPYRKDVLELLHRLFDRENLRLIPALEFDAPIPGLEEIIRRGGDETVGMQWVNAEGRTWRETHQNARGRGMYYNVFHPSVQEKMIEAFREVVDRYAGHSSFAGVAVKLAPESYARLASPEWGMDDVTIGRFERETGLQVSSGGPDRFAERAVFLAREENRAAWLQWRAKQAKAFYLRLRDELRKTNPQATLYLSDFNLSEESEPARPPLSRDRQRPESLLQAGIDPAHYAKEDSVELVFSQRTRAMLPPDGSLAADERAAFERTPGRSVLFEHEPAKHALASFDAKSPWPSYTSLVSQPTPSGEQNRRRFVSWLAANDAATVFDGGWLLPMGQEDALRDLASVYVALPRVRFEDVKPEDVEDSVDLITVRQAVYEGKTYVYAVNDTGLRVKGRIAVRAPAKSQIAELTGRRVIEPIRSEGDQRYWSFDLEPYDVIAAKIASPNVQLAVTKTTLEEKVWSEIRRRVRESGVRASTLQQPPAVELVNADFENADSSLPGWQANGPAEIVKAAGLNGSNGVRVRGTQETASLSSDPFRIRPTGKLTVTVALRVTDETSQPALRLSVSGTGTAGDFYRYAYLGKTSDGKQAATPLSSRWQRIALGVDDVPLEGLETLSVGFDLLGEGEVFIDEVEVHDLLFEKNERIELAKLISLAGIHLEKGQLRDCLAILDSYWFRFLEENVPVRPEIVARHAALSELGPRKPAAKTEKEPKSFFDRMKGLWPSRTRY